MKANLLWIALLAACAASPAQAQRSGGEVLCDFTELRSGVAEAQGRPLAEKLPEILQGKDLLIIGDEHSYSRTDVLVAIAGQVASRFKSQRLCLFLEVPSSISLAAYEGILADRGGDEGNRRYRDYYSRILNGFRAQGFVVHLADHPENSSRDVPMNDRDDAMASAIKKLHADGACQRGVLIVGKAHVAPDEANRTPIQERLRPELRPVTLNLISAQDRIPNPLLSSWSRLCPSKAYQPSEAILFPTHPSFAWMPIYPLATPMIKYLDFDWVLLTPAH